MGVQKRSHSVMKTWLYTSFTKQEKSEKITTTFTSPKDVVNLIRNNRIKAKLTSNN